METKGSDKNSVESDGQAPHARDGHAQGANEHSKHIEAMSSTWEAIYEIFYSLGLDSIDTCTGSELFKSPAISMLQVIAELPSDYPCAVLSAYIFACLRGSVVM